MLHIDPSTLTGTHLQLEVLNHAHFDELNSAAQDTSIWTFTASSAFGDSFQQWFDNALEGLHEKECIPFVVRRLSDQKIIGSTRYYHINAEHHRSSIGYTWYIKDVWGTFVNPECKYLLLQHAFENLNINRVEFTIDSRNARSWAAIKKLGATEEGILRQHMIIENGSLRDTVVLSIIKPEWPKIKMTLEKRLKIT